MKILVTGCAGFIGSHVVERLLKDGHEVVGVDDFDLFYSRSVKERNLLPFMLNPRFRFEQGDLAEMSLAKVLKGMEAVVHLAAQPGVRNSWGASFHRYVTNNVLVTQRLLEESKGRKLRRLVYASSSSVYGDLSGVLNEDMRPMPKSPYGITKLSAEHLCRLYHAEYGVPVVSLRFFSVYGPRQRPDMAFYKFCQALLQDTPITLYGDGKQVRDFTYVDDVVDAVVSALDREVSGEILNVGGGSPATLLEALTVLEEVSGRTAPKTFLERQRGDVLATQADTGKIERLLAFKPRVPLREGLARQWEWVEKHAREEADMAALKQAAARADAVRKAAEEATASPEPEPPGDGEDTAERKAAK
jgi:UDP-glucose 4-epimerase